ncbi:MAG: MotA/TolQ/ExbB proton channel family protein, partial [Planctomycetota bacterium]
LLSFWLMTGVLAVFSGATLMQSPLAAAEDGEILDDELGPDQPAEPEKTPAAADAGESVLTAWASALGWFFGPVFLCISFTLVALFVMNLLTARRENVVPVALLEGFEAHLNEKRYQEAYEMAKSDESFLGQALSAGLAKLSAGYDQAIEAMQEVGEDENMKLEHRLSYVGLIGAISPMVGLLGTVWGMIKAFEKIGIAGAAVKPQQLAGDISTALLTTLFGLAIAIPAIAAYNILRNRVQRLVLEVGILSEGLMSRFSTVVSGTAAAGAAKKPQQR